MKTWIAIFGALAVIMGAGIGDRPLRAQDSMQASSQAQQNQFAKRLFGQPVQQKAKSYACFARRYDAAHLARHPAQKVAAMRLLVSAEIVPEDKLPNYTFALALKFRERAGDFRSGGSCGHPNASQETKDKLTLGCGVDCDGGGVSLELADADKSMLLRVDRVAIWDNNKSDEERTGLEGGVDDHLFKMSRVPLEQCKPLMTDGEADKPATM